MKHPKTNNTFWETAIDTWYMVNGDRQRKSQFVVNCPDFGRLNRDLVYEYYKVMYNGHPIYDAVTGYIGLETFTSYITSLGCPGLFEFSTGHEASPDKIWYTKEGADAIMYAIIKEFSNHIIPRNIISIPRRFQNSSGYKALKSTSQIRKETLYQVIVK